MPIKLTKSSKIGLFFRNQEHAFWSSIWCMQQPLMSGSLNVNHMKNDNVRSLFDLILTDVDIDAPSVHRIGTEDINQIQLMGVESDFLLNSDASRIVLTSGTTGTPKAAVISAQTLHHRIKNLQENFTIDPSTVLWSLMGLDTIGGFTFPLATLLSGGKIHWLGTDDWQFKEFKANFAQVNLVLSAPNRIASVLRARDSDWPNKNARVLITGGSQIHPKIRDLALQVFCKKVINLYGSTEAGTIAYVDAKHLDNHPELAGMVTPHHLVEVVDENRNHITTGKVGEIRIASKLLADGYLEQGKITPFADSYYYPGDLGAVNSQGYLFITGRCDDVINLGGVKFNAAHIEKKIKMIDLINDCCLFLHVKDGVQKIALLVETQEKDTNKLKVKIREETGFDKNFSLIKVAAIPRNPMGKIPRKALSLWFEDQSRARDVAPNTQGPEI